MERAIMLLISWFASYGDISEQVTIQGKEVNNHDFGTPYVTFSSLCK